MPEKMWSSDSRLCVLVGVPSKFHRGYVNTHRGTVYSSFSIARTRRVTRSETMFVARFRGYCGRCGVTYRGIAKQFFNLKLGNPVRAKRSIYSHCRKLVKSIFRNVKYEFLNYCFPLWQMWKYILICFIRITNSCHELDVCQRKLYSKTRDKNKKE